MRLRQGSVCWNLSQFGCGATPARQFERLKDGSADPCSHSSFTASSGHWDSTRHVPISSFSKHTLPVCSLMLTVRACDFTCRGETGEGPVHRGPDTQTRTCPHRLTPRNKNECLAVAQTLNEEAKKLSRQSRRAVPPEFPRVASDLDQSCGAEDFNKAWISIEWLNGCLNNFSKDAELGFCSRNEGYSCALDLRSDACSQRR
jgi:hypothetical protein